MQKRVLLIHFLIIVLEIRIIRIPIFWISVVYAMLLFSKNSPDIKLSLMAQLQINQNWLYKKFAGNIRNKGFF